MYYVFVLDSAILVGIISREAENRQPETALVRWALRRLAATYLVTGISKFIIVPVFTSKQYFCSKTE